ncbi:MAG: trypsin-like peptidase domain-containing protein [Thiobacillaceae bacterium]
MHLFRFGLAALMLMVAPAAHPGVADSSAWVLKVEVVQNDGTRELGSGVVIALHRVVTNCHVVRNARSIMVSRGEESWPATMESGDEYRDLCFLSVPGFFGAVSPMAPQEYIRVGAPVYAVGYSDGQFTISAGFVKGLYVCACDGGRVIRVSAPFDPGASGGGLFDPKGRLLGILTFKAVSGGDFHFAVPVGWMRMLGEEPSLGVMSGKGGFWQQVTTSSNYFLVACDLNSKKDWRGLLKLSLDWTRQEPYNPEAWMSLGRAHLNEGEKEAAEKDFQKVLQLDSTNGDAAWELQKLQFDLNRPFMPHE